MKPYILIDKIPVVSTYDNNEWQIWDNNNQDKKRVDYTLLPNGIKISTIFLGLDHSFDYSEGHIPVLFETMIFGGNNDQYQKRYTTWDEAEKGHAHAVTLASIIEEQFDDREPEPYSGE